MQEEDLIEGRDQENAGMRIKFGIREFDRGGGWNYVGRRETYHELGLGVGRGVFALGGDLEVIIARLSWVKRPDLW